MLTKIFDRYFVKNSYDVNLIILEVGYAEIWLRYKNLPFKYKFVEKESCNVDVSGFVMFVNMELGNYQTVFVNLENVDNLFIKVKDEYELNFRFDDSSSFVAKVSEQVYKDSFMGDSFSNIYGR